MIVGGLPAETREPQARIFRPIGCGWTSEGLFRTWRVQLQPFNQGATTRNCYLPYVTHRMLLPGGGFGWEGLSWVRKTAFSTNGSSPRDAVILTQGQALVGVWPWLEAAGNS